MCDSNVNTISFHSFIVWFYVWAHNASALVTVECAIELDGFGVALTIPPWSCIYPGLASFLTYIHPFKIIPQINWELSGSSTWKGLYPEPSADMFMVTCVLDANSDLKGEIVPLECLCSLLQVTPVFGQAVDKKLTQETSLEYSSQFWINKYFDKELYYALTLL